MCFAALVHCLHKCRLRPAVVVALTQLAIDDTLPRGPNVASCPARELSGKRMLPRLLSRYLSCELRRCPILGSLCNCAAVHACLARGASGGRPDPESCPWLLEDLICASTASVRCSARSLVYSRRTVVRCEGATILKELGPDAAEAPPRNYISSAMGSVSVCS